MEQCFESGDQRLFLFYGVNKLKGVNDMKKSTPYVVPIPTHRYTTR